jgi:hypothetical protein
MDQDFIEDIALTRFSSPFAGMFIPNQKINWYRLSEILNYRRLPANDY